jgi:hypothetical protein
MLVPTCLYGDTKTTRKHWRKLIARAWESPDDPAIFDLPCISFEDNNAPIVIYEMAPGWRTQDAIWHLNWVHSCWAFPRGNGFGVASEQFRLVMNGLRHPWYAMGMLYPWFTDLFFLNDEFVISDRVDGVADRASYQRRFVTPLLDRMLYWINELAPLANRFWYAYPHLDLQKDAGAWWLAKCVRLAWVADFLDLDALRTVSKLSWESAVQHLLATGRIVRHEGRLRVAELVS